MFNFRRKTEEMNRKFLGALWTVVFKKLRLFPSTHIKNKFLFSFYYFLHKMLRSSEKSKNMLLLFIRKNFFMLNMNAWKLGQLDLFKIEFLFVFRIWPYKICLRKSVDGGFKNRIFFWTFWCAFPENFLLRFLWR